MKPWWRKYRIRLILATIGTVVSTIVRLKGLVGFTPWEQVFLAVFTFAIILLLWEAFVRIHDTLNKKIPFTENFFKRAIIQSICNSIVLLVIRWSGVYFIVDHLPIKLNHLNYVMLVAMDIVAGITLTLAFAVSYFIGRWKEGIIRNERLSKEKAEMQIHNLRNRVNPHFLFNALSALDGLIKTQPELASKFLQHLSKVYRYSLQNEDRESVSLDTELAVFKHFASLLEIRYGKSLVLDVVFTEDVYDKGIVPLTLEMLTENALKHNEITDENPLHIRIYNVDDELIVENSLRIKKTMETSNKKGLIQLKSLYSFLSEKSFVAEEQGSLFVVKLPLL